MFKKRTLYLLAAVLIAEAAVFVLMPSRMPRAARAIGAAVNVAAAAALCLLARQRGPDRP